MRNDLIQKLFAFLHLCLRAGENQLKLLIKCERLRVTTQPSQQITIYLFTFFLCAISSAIANSDGGVLTSTFASFHFVSFHWKYFAIFVCVFHWFHYFPSSTDDCTPRENISTKSEKNIKRRWNEIEDLIFRWAIIYRWRCEKSITKSSEGLTVSSIACHLNKFRHLWRSLLPIKCSLEQLSQAAKWSFRSKTSTHRGNRIVTYFTCRPSTWKQYSLGHCNRARITSLLCFKRRMICNRGYL